MMEKSVMTSNRAAVTLTLGSLVLFLAVGACKSGPTEPPPPPRWQVVGDNAVFEYQGYTPDFRILDHLVDTALPRLTSQQIESFGDKTAVAPLLNQSDFDLAQNQYHVSNRLARKLTESGRYTAISESAVQDVLRDMGITRFDRLFTPEIRAEFARKLGTLYQVELLLLPKLTSSSAPGGDASKYSLELELVIIQNNRSYRAASEVTTTRIG